MPGRPLHLTVIVGACATASNLRSSLQAQGVSHVAMTSSVASLRRCLVRGEHDLLVLCIVLDEETLEAQGASILSLLSDHHCSRTSLRSVGLLTDLGMSPDVARLGCNVYVDSTEHAAYAIRQMVEDWNELPVEPLHHAAVIRDAWVYGKPEFVRSMPAALRGAFLGQGARPATGERSSHPIPHGAWRMTTDRGETTES